MTGFTHNQSAGGDVIIQRQIAAGQLQEPCPRDRCIKHSRVRRIGEHEFAVVDNFRRRQRACTFHRDHTRVGKFSSSQLGRTQVHCTQCADIHITSIHRAVAGCSQNTRCSHTNIQNAFRAILIYGTVGFAVVIMKQIVGIGSNQICTIGQFDFTGTAGITDMHTIAAEFNRTAVHIQLCITGIQFRFSADIHTVQFHITGSRNIDHTVVVADAAIAGIFMHIACSSRRTLPGFRSEGFQRAVNIHHTVAAGRQIGKFGHGRAIFDVQHIRVFTLAMLIGTDPDVADLCDLRAAFQRHRCDRIRTVEGHIKVVGSIIDIHIADGKVITAMDVLIHPCAIFSSEDRTGGSDRHRTVQQRGIAAGDDRAVQRHICRLIRRSHQDLAGNRLVLIRSIEQLTMCRIIGNAIRISAALIDLNEVIDDAVNSDCTIKVHHTGVCHDFAVGIQRFIAVSNIDGAVERRVVRSQSTLAVQRFNIQGRIIHRDHTFVGEDRRAIAACTNSQRGIGNIHRAIDTDLDRFAVRRKDRSRGTVLDVKQTVFAIHRADVDAIIGIVVVVRVAGGVHIRTHIQRGTVHHDRGGFTNAISIRVISAAVVLTGQMQCRSIQRGTIADRDQTVAVNIGLPGGSQCRIVSGHSDVTHGGELHRINRGVIDIDRTVVVALHNGVAACIRNRGIDHIDRRILTRVKFRSFKHGIVDIHRGIGEGHDRQFVICIGANDIERTRLVVFEFSTMFIRVRASHDLNRGGGSFAADDIRHSKRIYHRSECVEAEDQTFCRRIRFSIVVVHIQRAAILVGDEDIAVSSLCQIDTASASNFHAVDKLVAVQRDLVADHFFHINDLAEADAACKQFVRHDIERTGTADRIRTERTRRINIHRAIVGDAVSHSDLAAINDIDDRLRGMCPCTVDNLRHGQRGTIGNLDLLAAVSIIGQCTGNFDCGTIGDIEITITVHCHIAADIQGGAHHSQRSAVNCGADVSDSRRRILQCHIAIKCPVADINRRCFHDKVCIVENRPCVKFCVCHIHITVCIERGCGDRRAGLNIECCIRVQRSCVHLTIVFHRKCADVGQRSGVHGRVVDDHCAAGRNCAANRQLTIFRHIQFREGCIASDRSFGGFADIQHTAEGASFKCGVFILDHQEDTVVQRHCAVHIQFRSVGNIGVTVDFHGADRHRSTIAGDIHTVCQFIAVLVQDHCRVVIDDHFRIAGDHAGQFRIGKFQRTSAGDRSSHGAFAADSERAIVVNCFRREGTSVDIHCTCVVDDAVGVKCPAFCNSQRADLAIFIRINPDHSIFFEVAAVDRHRAVNDHICRSIDVADGCRILVTDDQSVAHVFAVGDIEFTIDRHIGAVHTGLTVNIHRTRDHACLGTTELHAGAVDIQHTAFGNIQIAADHSELIAAAAVEGQLIIAADDQICIVIHIEVCAGDRAIAVDSQACRKILARAVLTDIDLTIAGNIRAQGVGIHKADGGVVDNRTAEGRIVSHIPVAFQRRVQYACAGDREGTAVINRFRRKGGAVHADRAIVGDFTRIKRTAVDVQRAVGIDQVQIAGGGQRTGHIHRGGGSLFAFTDRDRTAAHRTRDRGGGILEPGCVRHLDNSTFRHSHSRTIGVIEILCFDRVVDRVIAILEEQGAIHKKFVTIERDIAIVTTALPDAVHFQTDAVIIGIYKSHIAAQADMSTGDLGIRQRGSVIHIEEIGICRHRVDNDLAIAAEINITAVIEFVHNKRGIIDRKSTVCLLFAHCDIRDIEFRNIHRCIFHKELTGGRDSFRRELGTIDRDRGVRVVGQSCRIKRGISSSGTVVRIGDSQRTHIDRAVVDNFSCIKRSTADIDRLPLIGQSTVDVSLSIIFNINNSSSRAAVKTNSHIAVHNEIGFFAGDRHRDTVGGFACVVADQRVAVDIQFTVHFRIGIDREERIGFDIDRRVIRDHNRAFFHVVEDLVAFRIQFVFPVALEADVDVAAIAGPGSSVKVQCTVFDRGMFDHSHTIQVHRMTIQIPVARIRNKIAVLRNRHFNVTGQSHIRKTDIGCRRSDGHRLTVSQAAHGERIHHSIAGFVAISIKHIFAGVHCRRGSHSVRLQNRSRSAECDIASCIHIARRERTAVDVDLRAIASSIPAADRTDCIDRCTFIHIQNCIAVIQQNVALSCIQRCAVVHVHSAVDPNGSVSLTRRIRGDDIGVHIERTVIGKVNVANFHISIDIEVAAVEESMSRSDLVAADHRSELFSGIFCTVAIDHAGGKTAGNRQVTQQLHATRTDGGFDQRGIIRNLNKVAAHRTDIQRRSAARGKRTIVFNRSRRKGGIGNIHRTVGIDRNIVRRFTRCSEINFRIGDIQDTGFGSTADLKTAAFTIQSDVVDNRIGNIHSRNAVNAEISIGCAAPTAVVGVITLGNSTIADTHAAAEVDHTVVNGRDTAVRDREEAGEHSRIINIQRSDSTDVLTVISVTACQCVCSAFDGCLDVFSRSRQRLNIRIFVEIDTVNGVIDRHIAIVEGCPAAAVSAIRSGCDHGVLNHDIIFLISTGCIFAASQFTQRDKRIIKFERDVRTIHQSGRKDFAVTAGDDISAGSSQSKFRTLRIIDHLCNIDRSFAAECICRSKRILGRSEGIDTEIFACRDLCAEIFICPTAVNKQRVAVNVGNKDVPVFRSHDICAV